MTFLSEEVVKNYYVTIDTIRVIVVQIRKVVAGYNVENIVKVNYCVKNFLVIYIVVNCACISIIN